MIDEDLVKGHASETAFWMAGVYSPSYPARLLGELATDVSTKLRAMAIFRLLADGKTNSFYHNLIRSGMVRRRYLQRCRDENFLDDHFRGSGRYLPLFDTIAAGDFILAGEIIDLSPTEFMRGHEYEDDYCYAQIVHGLLTGGNTPGASFLARFERYLEGSPNGRFLVARSLLETDQPAFDSAFERLLSDREREIAADKKRGQIESPPIVALRRIFVEGLAVLRVAGKLGLKTEEQYLFCPAIARAPMTEPFPGE